MSLIEMVMVQHSKEISRTLFASVDRNTFNENVNFTFSTKYYYESYNRMIGISPYIFGYQRMYIL